jgi:phage/plasmid-like protein (TIGR03299 family)
MIEVDNIAKIDGKDTFAFSGKRPWHKLGTQIPGLMTVEEALIAGNLDWEVEKREVMTADTDMVIIPNIYAMGRVGPEKNKDGDLRFIPFEATVKGRYTIVQTREAFDFFNTAIHEKVACIETVGALGKGAVVFAMARLPDDFEPIKGDPIERYILLTTTHDGSGTIQAIFTTIRVVCQNTFNAALAGATNVVKIRHTKNAKTKLAQAHKMLKASETYWDKISEAYKAMSLKDMTRLDVINFVETMFPGKLKKVVKNDGAIEEIVEVSTRTENNRLKVVELFTGGADGSTKATAGSVYQMYNAITQFVDRDRVVRKNTDRWQASVFGSGSNFRQKAFNNLISLV